MEQLGLEVLTTREPGGVISAEKIREVILNNNIDILLNTHYLF